MTQPPPLRVAAYLVGVAGLAFCIARLRYATVAAVIVGIVLAAWLFGALAATSG
jgi:hypothetical protein